MTHLLHNLSTAKQPFTEGLMLAAIEEVPHRPCLDPAVLTDSQQQAIAADVH